MLFGNLIYGTVLFLNAIVILNEERFLARIGWARNNIDVFTAEDSAKAKLINLIYAIRTVMR
ncbi:hypothetical protein BB560_005948, partial [Smittium megazygosporum]